MTSGEMKKLWSIGHRPHSIDQKKYGSPVIALWWADKRFEKPGLWVSVNFGTLHQTRIMPWRRK